MQTALLRFGVKIMVTPYCLNEDTMLLSTVSPKKYTPMIVGGQILRMIPSAGNQSIQGQKETA